MAPECTTVRPRRRQHLEERLFGKELVVFNMSRGTAACLDLFAGAIWEMCDGRHTTAGIARELATIAGAERSRVKADVDRVVTQLRTSGLLEDLRNESAQEFDSTVREH